MKYQQFGRRFVHRVVQREVTAIMRTQDMSSLSSYRKTYAENCHYYHKSETSRAILKTADKLSPSHHVSYPNRATPLMDVNIPPYNAPQANTAPMNLYNEFNCSLLAYYFSSLLIKIALPLL